MSVLANYSRYRFLWGGADIEFGTGQYPSGVTNSTGLGATAAPGDGVGVRRCVVHFDRTGIVTGEDDAECHFDFLNITGGDPDDTWTDADYESLEDKLDDFWAAILNRFRTSMTLAGYHWYRHGPAIPTPNPAERVVTRSVAGTSSSTNLPPQVACSLTLRTGLRRSWGRTYLPAPTSDVLQNSGKLVTSIVDQFAAALADLYEAANGDDFPMVVVSKAHQSVYAIEAVECDDILDVIRRRRFGNTTYRVVTNT